MGFLGGRESLVVRVVDWKGEVRVVFMSLGARVRREVGAILEDGKDS